MAWRWLILCSFWRCFFIWAACCLSLILSGSVILCFALEIRNPGEARWFIRCLLDLQWLWSEWVCMVWYKESLWNFFCKITIIRSFYDKINIIRRAFYYGKTKETCTQSTNDRWKKISFVSFSKNTILRLLKISRMLLKISLAAPSRKWWRQKWMTISDMRNPSVLTTTIIETAINASR